MLLGGSLEIIWYKRLGWGGATCRLPIEQFLLSEQHPQFVTLTALSVLRMHR